MLSNANDTIKIVKNRIDLVIKPNAIHTNTLDAAARCANI